MDEATTQKLRFMKKTHGDELLAEWTKDRPDLVEYARSSFRTNFTAGRLAFRLDGPGNQTLIKEFDESAPEILIIPAVIGG